MRSSKKLTRYVTGAALALLMATAVTGCEASDEFEYMKSERQMMRHGDYGPGMSDADRQKLQESYASKQLSKVTPTSRWRGTIESGTVVKRSANTGRPAPGAARAPSSFVICVSSVPRIAVRTSQRQTCRATDFLV